MERNVTVQLRTLHYAVNYGFTSHVRKHKVHQAMIHGLVR